MMNWIEFITTMFTLGCDVSGYVGLVITAEQYKQITGKDYVAPTQAQMIIQSPQKHTVPNGAAFCSKEGLKDAKSNYSN